MRDEVTPLVDSYIDIHSSAVGSLNSPRAIICGDFSKIDPAVRKRCDEMADACNIEVIFKPAQETWKGMYFQLVPFFESRGVAKIVIETGCAPTLLEVDVIREGIYNIMKQTQMIAGAPSKSNEQVYCGGLVAIRSNSGGIFRSTVKLRDWVKAGDKLGK